MTRSLTIEVVLERKQAALPAFVVVPAAKIERWKLEGTTTVDAVLGGVALGRRSLKRWDDERWFLELRNEHLAEVAKPIGTRLTLVIAPASEDLPEEMQRLFELEPDSRTRWDALTKAQRRGLREEVLAAKSSAARERRARRALLDAVDAAPAARTRGAARATDRSKSPATKNASKIPGSSRVRVRIDAHDLPGSACGPYSDVFVGLVEEPGVHPSRMVSGAAREASWEIAIDVRNDGGALAFRGKAVHGRAPERFLYLVWIGREGRAPAAMFRRAKLRLDVVPLDVLALACESGVLVGRVGLTDARGMPLCASVKPPVVAWSSG